jgi:hypothetical protein
MKHITWLSFLFLLFISSANAAICTIESKYSNSIELNNHNKSIIISKGQQIKINEDSRKFFYQSYDSETNTLKVKDVNYRVFYTERRSIEYNLDEINRIQIRTDDIKPNPVQMYLGLYAHMMPQAVVGGVFLGIFGGISTALSGKEEYQPGDGAAIMMGGMFVNALVNVWPTTAKLGRGNWISIPLEGDDAWELSSIVVNY